MSVKWGWEVTKGAFNEFSEDRVPRLSAALAYYSIFSLGPLLMLIVGLAGLFFGQESVRQDVRGQLQGMVGPKAAATVESMMMARQQGGSLVSIIVGVAGLLLGASGVFGQLQDALNTIWEVQPKPGRGAWGFIRDRFLSFTMVLGIGFLLLVSMVLSTVLAAFAGTLNRVLPIPEAAIHLLNFVVSFGVITLLFALIFKYLPDVKIQWRDVWIGAAGTALLFTIGKFLLSLYLGRQSTASAYGAAGSIVVLLLWFYYAALILFFGAEFTQVYATKRGSQIVPSKNAIRVTGQERAKQGMPRPRQLQESGRSPSPPSGAPAPATPGAVLRKHPWQFASIGLALAVAAGLARRTGLSRVLRWGVPARRKSASL